MSRLKRLIQEIHRRSLWQVLGIYLVGAWVAFQGIEALVSGLGLPEWVPGLAVVMLIAGLPIVLATAFVQEGVGAGEAPAEAERTAEPADAGGLHLVLTWRNVILGGVAVVLLAGILAAAWLLIGEEIAHPPGRPDTSGPPLTSIAVLPFDDLSPDGNQRWLAGGMAEELIESLSRIGKLRVIARTSSELAKTSGADIPTIGERLQIGAIVEGSVRRSGDQIRVTAQLIRVADESHLWSARYDRTLDDVFAIQQEIAREIAEAVRLQLGIEEWSRLSESRYLPKDVRAYEQFRKGYELGNSTFSEEVLRKAEKHYLEALAIDPGYAQAQAGLAWNHWRLWELRYDARDARLASARAAALRALELDQRASGADTLLAQLSVQAGDWNSAERRLERALEVLPDASGLRSVYAMVLSQTGRIDEALIQARRAVDLDPLYFSRQETLGSIYVAARDYEAAIEALEYSLDLNPNQPYTAGPLAIAYHQRGMDKEALEAALRLPFIAANPELQAAVRRGFAEGGWGEMSRAAIAELAAQTGTPCSPNPPLGAFWYAGAGDADKMFQCLDEAVAERGNVMLNGLVGPTWDPYRDDPRFQVILRRLGLAE